MNDDLRIYTEIFTLIDDYNVHPTDERRYVYLNEFLKEKDFTSLIDIGTGRGHMFSAISANKLTDIVITDLAQFNMLPYRFYAIDLLNFKNFHKNFNRKFDVLTCLDVLEHLEEKYLDDVLHEFSLLADNFVFTAANHEEIIGPYNLHKTCQPRSFWEDKFSTYFRITQPIESYYDDRLFLFTCEQK